MCRNGYLELKKLSNVNSLSFSKFTKVGNRMSIIYACAKYYINSEEKHRLRVCKLGFASVHFLLRHDRAVSNRCRIGNELGTTLREVLVHRSISKSTVYRPFDYVSTIRFSKDVCIFENNGFFLWQYSECFNWPVSSTVATDMLRLNQWNNNWLIFHKPTG